MEAASESPIRKWLGRCVGVATVGAAAVLLVVVIQETARHPRTDDANVRANFIEIVAEVSGRLVELPVKDNALVKKGSLLFAIDSRPYEYTLRQALSDQADLEQRIIDEGRKIAAQNSAVEAARATLAQSATGIRTAVSSVDVTKATVSRAQAAATAARAQLSLATNNLNRIEPLLEKQYVTVEQVDTARTALRVAQGNFDESEAALAQAQAQQAQAEFRRREADSQTAASQARLDQSVHAIDRIETLISERPAKAAKVDSARLDLERCRVLSPFDAYVTNMNISEGAYAHPGGAMFTLVDTRAWWVVANYREAELKGIHRGGHVEVYLMEHPDRKFSGVVESIGYAVFPEDGKVSSGLPDIEKTLNWVHLSSRFPVRVRVEHPDPSLFRIGASAVTVAR
ncbi:MAG: secretion protein HlyD family protein [Bryobacterales bacterium]|nr:secretion protein HlyD family protein [Bryobacterales bacterium]